MKNYTRSALGLLSNQYKLVLKKCFLINSFALSGILAFNCSANAAELVTTYNDLLSALSASSTADVVLDTNGAGISLDNPMGIIISSEQKVTLQNIGTEGESAWTVTNGTKSQIKNSGELSIDSVFYKNSKVDGGSVAYLGSFINNEGHITAITNTEFSDNETSNTSAAPSLWGGIICNKNSIGIDLIQNVVFNNNLTVSGNQSPHGGAINNENSRIKLIDNVTFSNNTMYGPENKTGGTLGVGIVNMANAYIDKITNSVFLNNYAYRLGEELKTDNYHASGAGLANYDYIGEISNTIFKGNHLSTESISASATGAALFNLDTGEDTQRGHIDKIENVEFINNYIEATGRVVGGAISTGGYIGYIKANFSGNSLYSSKDYAYGGAIYNTDTIGDIDGNFNNNYANSTESYARGGAIYNTDTIGDITGDFVQNYTTSAEGYAYGGAIYGYAATIGDIKGNFSNNYAKSDAAQANGGAIMFYGRNNAGVIKKATIKSIEGNFNNNYAIGYGRTSGGAINANNYSEVTNGIKGNFNGNYAKSTGTSALARGGAILSIGYIKSLEGDFSDNYAESAGTGAIGGALALLKSASSSSKIDSIKSNFINNRAVATGNGYAQGGAIYNLSGAEISTIQDAVFSGNYAQSASGEAEGGAIWNQGTIGFSGTNTFSGNYVKQGEKTTANDIYNSGIINIAEDAVMNISGGINGEAGRINMGSGSVLNLEAELSDNTITADNSTIKVKEAGSFGNNTVLNINEGSLLEIEPVRVTVSEANFAAGSTLSLKVTDLAQEGVLYANTLRIAPAEQATIKINVAQGVLSIGRSADVQVLKADNDFENTFQDDIIVNTMYDFVRKAGREGWYTITKKTTSGEIAQGQGATKTEIDAADAWVDGDKFTEGTISAEVAERLSELAQNDDPEFREAISVIVPAQSPMIQMMATETSDRVMTTIDNYLSGGKQGDILTKEISRDSTLWAKGYYGKSEFTDSRQVKGFDVKNKGIIVGADKKLDKSVRLGAGMHYNEGDVDGNHQDITADTVAGFIYGEYKPSDWFVNAMASIGQTRNKEKRYALGYKISDKYDVDVYSMQSITGYNMKYITPEIGARYYHIKRKGYEDSIGQKVGSENMDMLRAVFGVRSSYEYEKIKPEVYVGLTYDLVSEKDAVVVDLPNGGNYILNRKRLNRLGAEISVGVTMNVTDKTTLGLSYEGRFREHYYDNTGLLSAKYEF